MSRDPEAVATPAAPAYLLDPYADRDRLYEQYELVRAEVNAGLDRALARGGLSTDLETARWHALDVGCGEGLFAAELVRRYPHVHVTGFDRDPEAILTATTTFGRPGQLMFFTHDACQPLPRQFAAGPATRVARRFDLIFANVVLMHIREAPAVLGYLAAVLKPGGVMYLRDWPAMPLPFPHPSFAALSALGVEALRRTGNADFAQHHAEHLAAVGLTDITRETYTYAIGGPTAAGQRMLRNMITSFRTGRHGLVDQLQMMAPGDYDAHLARLEQEVTADMACDMTLVATSACKPRPN